jgi:hypothetical protein
MNPRAVDLIIRSVTTAALALGVLAVAAYEAIHTGGVDAQTGAAFGLIIGVYFGAHVSQNGASSRGRGDAIITAEARGEPIPLDTLARQAPKGDG